jgi:cytoskeletal protein CcmA (bactofilin family)
MWQPDSEKPSTLTKNSGGENAPRQSASRKAVSEIPQEGSIIGKSIVIKGEVHGSEPLYIDGKIEGMINLPKNRVVLGQHAAVVAEVTGGEVVVSGTFRGNILAEDRLELRSEGSITGNVFASRIIIEEGALCKGSIDIRKQEPKQPGSGKEEAAQKLTAANATNEKANAVSGNVQEDALIAGTLAT